jgi:DNA repair protein RecN (Recombination protein N)
MLNELVVEGLGVIDRAELTLERGCCALTGETGAGKTLLVAALSLLLGGRSERAMVREGAGTARVEARFTVPPGHPAAALLAAHGVIEPPHGEAELVIARAVEANGKAGKARINGRMVTVGLLEEVGSAFAEIASQHAHRQLASAAAGRRILDSFAGEEAVGLADEVATAVRLAARARRRAEGLEAGARDRARELDRLRYEAAEIEGAAPSAGETERLTADARRLENAEALAVGLGAASSALHGEGGADELISRAAADLKRLAEIDPELAVPARRLEAAGIEVADVAGELAERVAGPDPEALEETRNRLALLARLKRKYGGDEGAVLEYLVRARARAAEIEAMDADIGTAEVEAARLEQEATDLAARLSDLRRAAAPGLERAAEELLAELALPGARVRVAVEPRALYEGGGESVDLLVAANPGETPRPVSKTVSGGELSRISLALHMLTASQAVETMVFDEVDAGIGGESAHSVGRTLARLSETSGAQVLVVTHLPQVAAHAASQYRVVKSVSGNRVTAYVEKVDGDERVAELSRMLAGLPASERAREHAQELLDLVSSGPQNNAVGAA